MFLGLRDGGGLGKKCGDGPKMPRGQPSGKGELAPGASRATVPKDSRGTVGSRGYERMTRVGANFRMRLCTVSVT